MSSNTNKVVFLSGACGSGKTTVAERLQRDHGFVHFDGDAWQNEFDAVAEAGYTMTPEHAQRAAKMSEGMRELSTGMVLAFMALRKGAAYDQGAFDRFYGKMCDDVLEAHSKCGKPMVVTHCAYTRGSRDLIRDKLSRVGGCVVVLEATADVVTDRLLGRYVEQAAAKGQSCEEWLQDTFKGAETMESLREKTLAQNAVMPDAVGPEEAGTVCVDVSKDGVDSVARSVLAGLGA